jgi:allantoicase
VHDPGTDYLDLIDLAAERLGGAVLLANDEFFAPKENLIRIDRPVAREGVYTDRGKWMDGWETRRRRSPGYDWCIVRLGRPGIIRRLLVDTSHFVGNAPESCSVDACAVAGAPAPERLAEGAEWVELLPRSAIRGDAHNPFPVDDERVFTHVRLNIYPDGGVARLRVHGEVVPDWKRLARPGVEVDLAAAANGGWIAACSDMFFGNRQNLIMPGLPLSMGDGWETRRRRSPGHDWVLLRLGNRGVLRRAIVDTTHFKGNAPASCSMEACDAPGQRLPDRNVEWAELLPESPLHPHTVHEFLDELRELGPVTHVRFNVFPDGGVARLRLFGLVS